MARQPKNSGLGENPLDDILGSTVTVSRRNERPEPEIPLARPVSNNGPVSLRVDDGHVASQPADVVEAAEIELEEEPLLDSEEGEQEVRGRAGQGSRQVVEASPKQPKRAAGRRIRASFYIPDTLLEECRDAAVYLAGWPVRLTLASLAETALRKELKRLKKEHHDGQEFPERPENLRGGRPIGS